MVIRGLDDHLAIFRVRDAHDHIDVLKLFSRVAEHLRNAR
jgi:hypothetical protein